MPAILAKESMKPHLDGFSQAIARSAASLNMEFRAIWRPREQNVTADGISKIKDWDDWGISDELFQFLNVNGGLLQWICLRTQSTRNV